MVVPLEVCVNGAGLAILALWGCRGVSTSGQPDTSLLGATSADSAGMDTEVYPLDRPVPPSAGRPPDVGGAPPSGPVDGMITVRSTMTSTTQGTATASVRVYEGVASFLVTATGPNTMLRARRVVDPNGVVVLDRADWGSGENITYAFQEGPVNVLGFPIREEDGALTAGTYTVEYTVKDEFWSRAPAGTSVDLAIQSKVDSDLGSGVLLVDVVLDDSLAALPGYSSAVLAAIDRWSGIWAPAGLEVAATVKSADLPYEVNELRGFNRFAGLSGPLYQSLSASGDDNRVTMVVAGSIKNAAGTLGVSGGVPGSLVASSESVMVVAAHEFAGVDGVFDSQEADLMGETMAHEAGHYLGLFHPVEANWVSFDAYADTATCSSRVECIKLLGTNLMFPLQLCGDGVCVASDQLTEQQTYTLHLYTGTQ